MQAKTLPLNTPSRHAAEIVAVATNRIAMSAMTLGAVRSLGTAYVALEAALRATPLPDRANVFGLDGQPENAWTVHCREHKLSTDHSLYTLINA